MIRGVAAVIALSIGLPIAAEECIAIEGVESLIEPGRVVLLGELHGTVESPTFALDLACHAAAASLHVVVGLEQPPAGQVAVELFLDSAGGEQSLEALLAGLFWQASYQDGRASWAMFDLIDGLRRLRSQGAAVSATLFDASGARGGQQRERDMAGNLAAAINESPDALAIVLTGNRHSRITPGAPRNSEYEPMGYLLRQVVKPDRLISLNVGHGGGSAWICSPGCGVTGLSGRRGDQRWAIEIDDATRPAGHHGWYLVGQLTASRPARMAPVSALSDHLVESPAAGSSSASPEARPDERGGEGGEAADPAPLSEEESKLQGDWRAYDFVTRSKLWKFRFEGRRFLADGGTDDWYEGNLIVRSDAEPAQIDFEIEDCRCSFKGMTSEGIFYWEADSIVIAAPEPGRARPSSFFRSSGQMMELVRGDVGN